MSISQHFSSLLLVSALGAMALGGCQEKKKKAPATSSKVSDSVKSKAVDVSEVSPKVETARPSLKPSDEAARPNSNTAPSFSREIGDAAFPVEIARPAARMSSTSNPGEHWRYIGMSCHEGPTPGAALDDVVKRLKAGKREASVQEVDGTVMVVSNHEGFETRFTPSPGVRCESGSFGLAIQMDKKQSN